MIIHGHEIAFRFDFVILSSMLLLEFDGFSSHKRLAAFKRDRHKQRHAQVNGWQVLPISNHAVRFNLSGLMQDIRQICQSRNNIHRNGVVRRKGLTKCVFEADVDS